MEYFEGRIDIAIKYGVFSAIILDFIEYHVASLDVDHKDICSRDGNIYFAAGYKMLRTAFPFITEYSIQQSLHRLIKEGVIESIMIKNDIYDRRKAYRPINGSGYEKASR